MMNKVFFLSFSYFKHGSSLFLQEWVLRISQKEGVSVGSVCFVPLRSEDLFFLNKKHLKHHKNTDVIAFDYSKNDFISGEVLFSIGDVIKNASLYKSSEENEFLRVMAHGFLHLLGYRDHKKKEALLMREKEDFYVDLYYKLFHVKPVFVYV